MGATPHHQAICSRTTHSFPPPQSASGELASALCLSLAAVWLQQAQDLIRTREVQLPNLITRSKAIVFKWTDLA
ncbi:unnamed protein product [Closterium sp. Yama58-4]|nr:unnamed protein product [Closterium sp. Yama58-4]